MGSDHSPPLPPAYRRARGYRKGDNAALALDAASRFIDGLVRGPPQEIHGIVFRCEWLWTGVSTYLMFSPALIVTAGGFPLAIVSFPTNLRTATLASETLFMST